MTVRPFRSDDFPDLLALVASNAAARPVGRTPLMNSDLVWQFHGAAPEDNIRLWFDAAGLCAFAWFQPPFELKFDLRADIGPGSGILGELLAWAEQRRLAFEPGYPFYLDLESMAEWREALQRPPATLASGDRFLVATALESDEARSAWLIGQGFQAVAHHEPILVHDLSSGTAPAPPPSGFRLRAVAGTELPARVELHRAAWAPASGFTLTQYRGLQMLGGVYDPLLDIVAEAADGTLAAYAIAWKDPVSGIGSFEPVGTRPEYRGSGVSEAVLTEGFHRLAKKGMRAVRIYTASFNGPAQRLYQRVGFQQVDVNRTYLKRISV